MPQARNHHRADLLGTVFLSVVLTFIVVNSPTPPFIDGGGDVSQVLEGFDVLKEQLQEHRSQSSLTISGEGITAWTNAVRKEAGLAPLNHSPILESIAKKRAKDMVRTGYYGHESINGYGADDMARYFRYRYLRYGENLAVGPFEDSRSAVQLWMESPDHRDNIQNPRFHEIGSAVDEGWIEGRQRVVAVQVFGLPAWHCPQIDESLLPTITAERVHQLEMERAAKELRKIVQYSNNPQEIAAYNDFLVRLRYRASEINRLTEEYNKQVKAFNECA